MPARSTARPRAVLAAVVALLATPLLATPASAEPAQPAAVTPDVQEIALGDPVADTQLSTPDDAGGTQLRLSASRPETAAFSTVGVTWAYAPDLAEVTVSVRTKDATTGAWSGWQPLEVEDGVSLNPAAPDPRSGTSPYWTGPATGVEVELTAPAGGPSPSDVRLTLIDPKQVPADTTLAAAPAVAVPESGPLAQPYIHTRLAWGADEGLRTWAPEYASTLKAAIIHHTVDRNDYAAEEVPGMLRAIYYYHSTTLGWGDIGYNFVVDRFGRVFEGRYGGVDSTVIGGHALGFNPYTTGVSMLGNYHETDTPAPMIDAVSSIVAWKFSLFGLDPHAQTQLSSADATLTVPTVLGHRDVNNTLCPGQYGYARLPEIRDKAATLLAVQTMSATP